MSWEAKYAKQNGGALPRTGVRSGTAGSSTPKQANRFEQLADNYPTRSKPTKRSTPKSATSAAATVKSVPVTYMDTRHFPSLCSTPDRPTQPVKPVAPQKGGWSKVAAEAAHRKTPSPPRKAPVESAPSRLPAVSGKTGYYEEPDYGYESHGSRDAWEDDVWGEDN